MITVMIIESQFVNGSQHSNLYAVPRVELYAVQIWRESVFKFGVIGENVILLPIMLYGCRKTPLYNEIVSNSKPRM